ncbi:sensor histidine kinase [Paenibacillus rhizovicinus]|uniref:Sensor histidine kinase n=1 Tax=Paenibacillus rhizovicinus TaxID=2704463 RepID=A0A6C0NXY2_9BACL|nr:sensor histidine kinase [Paenibacillus rhizovicinus]QHW30796.1 sensor histidine kinase [Paenibacillus rhizovicinus]
MNKRVSGIFPKLVIAFLAVIIPLFMLGLKMNRMGEDSVRSEWNNSMNSRTVFYLNTVELEFRHILDMLSENINDPDLSHLSVLSGIMSTYEWSETVKRVQEKLRLIGDSSLYAQNASVHLLTLGRTINDSIGVLDNIDPSYQAVRPKAGMDNPSMVTWNDRIFIRQVFPNGSIDPSYVLAVEINRSELKDMLDNMANYGGAGAALIDRSGLWSVTDGQSSGVENGGGSVTAQLRAFLKQKAHSASAAGGLNSPMKLNGIDMQTTCQYSSSLNAYLCLYIPQDQIFGKINSYRMLFWLLSAASILIVLLYSRWIYRAIHRPLREMIYSFRRVEDGWLEPVPITKGKDEFRYLYLHFNRMVDHLKTLIHDNYEQKLRAKQAQIKQLQSQINPHFLYNTYFILYRLSEFGDLESIGRFSRYLGEYFEFITRHKEDTIPLELELRHTLTYLEIQNMRFFNRFDIEIETLSDDCKSIFVPKLVLQPIVENAFKYGLEPRVSGGVLRMAFHRTANRMVIDVEDNGEQLTDAQLETLSGKLRQTWAEDESTGMINVHRRLRLLCGEESGITVSRGEGGGLKVSLNIQLEEKEEDMTDDNTTDNLA